MISLAVTRISRIRGSLLPAVLIPCLHDLVPVGPDQTPDLTQFPRVEPVVPLQFQRLQPELASLVLTVHVNVRGLVAIEACKEDSIRPSDAPHTRHAVTPSSHLTIGAHVRAAGPIRRPLCRSAAGRGCCAFSG